MGIRSAEKVAGERTQMTLPKAGNRVAILTGLVDLGIQPQEYKGEVKSPCREIAAIYTLPKDTYEDDEGNTKYCQIRPLPFKLLPGSDKAKYRSFYKAHDPEAKLLGEDGTGDVTLLLGTAVQLLVTHTDPAKDKDGFVYANTKIQDVSGLPEDYPVPEIDVDTFFFDTDEPSKDIFDKLGTFLQDKIRLSVDYAGSELEAALEGNATVNQKNIDAKSDDSPI